MWQILLPALSLGLISSFHCAGMCGPIALALPIYHLSTALKTIAVILYHSGRIITYSILGLLFGLLGRQFYLAGFQRWLSITAGVIILLVILQQQVQKKYGGQGFFKKSFDKVQNWIQYAWTQTTMAKFVLIGMLNGLLPCGMVYFALAATLSLSNPLNSVLFMAAFGAGTLPLMAGLHFFGAKYLSAGLRNKMRKAVPIFIAFMGVLLIMRGLNLAIPYLSPYTANDPTRVISCH